MLSIPSNINSSPFDSDAWGDVLVAAEKVRGVVFVFQRDEALVICAVSLSDAMALSLVQRVDVDLAGGKRLRRIEEIFCPLDVRRRRRRVIPECEDFKMIRSGTQAEGRRVRRHARNRTVAVLYNYGGPWRRRTAKLLEQRRDGGIA